MNNEFGVREFSIKYGFLVLLAGLILFFSIFASGFAGPRSAVFIFQSVAITGILALGVTCTLVVDGFDLSIGSVATSSLMMSAYMLVILEQSAFVAVVACLLMGAFVGLINGLLIVKMKVPDLLATLGMMFLLIGLQRVPTEGRSIATGMRLPSGEVADGVFPASFLWIGRHRFDVFLEKLIPVPVVIFLVVALIIWIFLELTRHGRLMYAIGSNERAASLAGTNLSVFNQSSIFGFLAIVLAAINIFGGFLVTQRMLAMYKKKRKIKNDLCKFTSNILSYLRNFVYFSIKRIVFSRNFKTR